MKRIQYCLMVSLLSSLHATENPLPLMRYVQKIESDCMKLDSLFEEEVKNAEVALWLHSNHLMQGFLNGADADVEGLVGATETLSVFTLPFSPSFTYTNEVQHITTVLKQQWPNLSAAVKDDIHTSIATAASHCERFFVECVNAQDCYEFCMHKKKAFAQSHIDGIMQRFDQLGNLASFLDAQFPKCEKIARIIKTNQEVIRSLLTGEHAVDKDRISQIMNVLGVRKPDDREYKALIIADCFINPHSTPGMAYASLYRYIVEFFPLRESDSHILENGLVEAGDLVSEGISNYVLAKMKFSIFFKPGDSSSPEQKERIIALRIADMQRMQKAVEVRGQELAQCAKLLQVAQLCEVAQKVKKSGIVEDCIVQ